MRKLIAALAALAVVAVAPGAGAVDVDGPSAGGFASDNIEWVGYVPFENDTSGARIVGKYLYITTSNHLQIYGLKNPESPERLGTVPLLQQPYFAQEDVDTNGNIALVGTVDGTLNIVDVEDKSNPTVVGQLEGAAQHTNSCVLDCTFAYGSGGNIVDLRDPANPKEVGSWTKGTPASSGGHDVTEVSPGLIVTSTQPVMLLDARKNPAKPKVLAVAGNKDGRFMHSNLWPNGMKDRWLLVGGETSGPSCDETDGAFMTWDTKGWQKSKTFTMRDEYRVTNGLPTDGNAPANLYCMHWFDTHPDYRNGGIVSVAWYEHGARFLEVTKDGKIKEAGFFIPIAGSTSAAYWVTDEIIYTADYNRGIDILRYTGK